VVGSCKYSHELMISKRRGIFFNVMTNHSCKNAAISFAVHVCLSIYPCVTYGNWITLEMIFIKNDTGEFSKIFCTFQFWSKSDNNNGHFE
jgi:hypothetical protein